MTDFLLLEKISELNSNVETPRLLHQKGVTACGKFCPYMSLSDYTQAEFLRDPDKDTPVTVRFSRAMGEAGCGDSLRDTRGFATRFATDQGNYDLICHNAPIYYIKEPDKFPNMVKSLAYCQRASGEEPNFWKFMAENPEAVNLAMWLYSNKGTLKSYRFMEGYSVNTYEWINEKDQRLYVRYHWNPVCERDETDERREGISYQEAEFLAGFSPDSCIRDLSLAMEEGNLPVYELEIQIMEEQKAENCGFDFLAPTLFWPEENFPYMKIGKMTLEHILRKEEGEKLCYTPSNLVPGIDFGNKRFLEIMAYAHNDGGRKRGVIR